MSELSTHSDISIEHRIITIQHIEIFDDPNRWKGYKIAMNDTTKNIICKSRRKPCCSLDVISRR